MSLISGLRPRAPEARLAWARHVLLGGPAPDDDGRDGIAAALRALALAEPAGGRGGMSDAPARPLVSILICTYNRDRWLAEAIASAHAQSWPVEVVVVDDGSDDGTAALLEAQAGITWVRHPENRGKPAALETGLALVRGAAYLVLDDDDLLLPGAVAALAEPLFADDALVATFGDTLVFDDATGQIVEWREASRLPGAMGRRAALTTIPAMPGATLVRSAVQATLAPFEPSLIRGQDMDHFLRLSAAGPWEGVPLPVQLYRRHDGMRGAAGARWQKHRDPAEHRARFLGCVQPVFLRRWRASDHDRAEGFAWALGLFERGLFAEAETELGRWPGPWSAHESAVRERLGHAPRAGSAGASPSAVATLLIDDGDDGALAALLGTRGADGSLEVITTAATPSVGAAQLFWPGTYRIQARLAPRTGPVQLLLSSAPAWLPPAVDAADLPPLPPRDAALALALALGWPLPRATRAVRGAPPPHPIVGRCLAARTRPLPEALAAAADVVQALPAWRPGRAMAAALCERAGLAQEARELRA